MCRPIYLVEIEYSIKQSTLAIGVEPIIRRMSIHSHKINFDKWKLNSLNNVEFIKGKPCRKVEG